MNGKLARMIATTIAGLSIGVSMSLAQTTSTNDETANKALVLEFVQDVFNDANVENVLDYVTPEYIENGTGIPSGAEVLAGSVMGLHAAFPDIEYTVFQIGAQDDLVAARIGITGTQQGDFMGIPASGRQVAAQTINFWRVTEGRLSEHWEVLDQLSFLTQLGVIPSQGEVAVPEFTEDAITEIVVAENTDESRAETLAVVTSLFEDVLNSQNVSAAEGIIAQNLTWHTTTFAAPGLEGYQAFYDIIFTAFPDVNRETVLTVTDGDLAFVLNQITGTQQAEYFGIPASGAEIDYASADIFRVVDGEITDLWDMADYVTLFTQLGVMGGQ